MQLKIQQVTVSYCYTALPGLGFYGGGQNIGRFLCEQDRLISDDTFLNIQVS